MSLRRTPRKLALTLSVLALLFGTVLPARAQKRVYARVAPNPEGTTEPLKFDINTEISDNISPNIVFSQDGTGTFNSTQRGASSGVLN